MGIAIVGTGSYLPDRVLTSAELGESLEVDEQWILDKTGIKERRVAAQEQISSDLGALAAQRAMAAAGVEAADIDLLIVSTSTPDQPVPATACFVQEKIGAIHAAAFDVVAGCTGSLHAISVGRALLIADPDRTTALIVGIGLYSRFLDYTDRRTCVLFGDGAGALVLRKTTGDSGIVTARLHSDGRLADVAQIPGGGTRYPASIQTVQEGKHHAKIQGGDIRRLINKLLPDLVSDMLKSSGWDWADVDIVVSHQANGAMLDEWIEILGIRPELMHRTVGSYGNTGAASIPITLDDAVRSGRLTSGDKVLLLGVGAGVTWGGITTEWAFD